MHLFKFLLMLTIASGYTQGFIYKCGDKITVKKGEKRSITFWGDEGELLKTDAKPPPPKPPNVVASSGIELLSEKTEEVKQKVSTSKKRPKIDMSLLERLSAALRPTKPVRPSEEQTSLLPEEEFVKNSENVPIADPNQDLFSSQKNPQDIKQTQVRLEDLPREELPVSPSQGGFLRPVTIQTKIERPTNRKEEIPLSSPVDEEILKAIELKENIASSDPVIKVTKEKEEEIASLELLKNEPEVDYSYDLTGIPDDTETHENTDIIEDPVDSESDATFKAENPLPTSITSPTDDSEIQAIVPESPQTPTLNNETPEIIPSAENEPPPEKPMNTVVLENSNKDSVSEPSHSDVPVIYNDEDIQTTIDELTQQLNNKESDKESISISLSILENLMSLMKENPTTNPDELTTTQVPEQNPPLDHQQEVDVSTQEEKVVPVTNEQAAVVTSNNQKTVDTIPEQTEAVKSNDETIVKSGGDKDISVDTHQQTSEAVVGKEEATTQKSEDKTLPVTGKTQTVEQGKKEEMDATVDENKTITMVKNKNTASVSEGQEVLITGNEQKTVVTADNKVAATGSMESEISDTVNENEPGVTSNKDKAGAAENIINTSADPKPLPDKVRAPTNNVALFDEMALPEVVSFPLPVRPTVQVDVQNEKISEFEVTTMPTELLRSENGIILSEDLLNSVSYAPTTTVPSIDLNEREESIETLSVDPLTSGLEAELSVNQEEFVPETTTMHDGIIESRTEFMEIEQETTVIPETRDGETSMEMSEVPIYAVEKQDPVYETRSEVEHVKLDTTRQDSKPAILGTRGDVKPQSDFHPELFEMRNVLQSVRLRGEPLINLQGSSLLEEQETGSSTEPTTSTPKVENNDTQGEILIPSDLIEFLKQESFPLDDDKYTVKEEDELQKDKVTLQEAQPLEPVEKDPKQDIDPLNAILELLEKHEMETSTDPEVPVTDNIQGNIQDSATETPQSYHSQPSRTDLEMESLSFGQYENSFEGFDLMERDNEDKTTSKPNVEKSKEMDKTDSEVLVESPTTELPTESKVEDEKVTLKQAVATFEDLLDKQDQSQIDEKTIEESVIYDMEDPVTVTISSPASTENSEISEDSVEPPKLPTEEVEDSVVSEVSKPTLDVRNVAVDSTVDADDIMAQVRDAELQISYVDNIEPVVIKEQGSKVIIQNPNPVLSDPSLFPLNSPTLTNEDSVLPDMISQTESIKNTEEPEPNKVEIVTPPKTRLTAPGALPPSDWIGVPKKDVTDQETSNAVNEEKETTSPLKNNNDHEKISEQLPNSSDSLEAGIVMLNSNSEEKPVVGVKSDPEMLPDSNIEEEDVMKKPFVRLEFTDDTIDNKRPTVTDEEIAQTGDQSVSELAAEIFPSFESESDGELPIEANWNSENTRARPQPVSVRIPDGLKDPDVIKLLRDSISFYEENTDNREFTNPLEREDTEPSQNQKDPQLSLSKDETFDQNNNNEKVEQSDLQFNRDNSGFPALSISIHDKPITEDSSAIEKDNIPQGQLQENTNSDRSDTIILPDGESASKIDNANSDPQSSDAINVNERDEPIISHKLQTNNKIVHDSPLLSRPTVVDEIQEELDSMFLPSFEPSGGSGPSLISPSDSIPSSSLPVEVRTPDESSIIDMIRDFIFSAPSSDGDSEKSSSHAPDTQQLINALSRQNSEANRRYNNDDNFDMFDRGYSSQDQAYGYEPIIDDLTPDHRLQTRKGLVDHEPPRRQEINSRHDDSPVHYAGDAPFFIKIPGSPNAVPVFLQYEPVKVNYVPADKMNSDRSDTLLPKNSMTPNLPPEILSEVIEQEKPVMAPDELDPFFIMEAPNLATNDGSGKEDSSANEENKDVSVTSSQGATVDVGGSLSLKGTSPGDSSGSKEEILYPGESYDASYHPDTASLSNPVFNLSPKVTVPTVDMNPQYTPFALTTNPPKATPGMTTEKTTTEITPNTTTKTPSSTEYSPVPSIRFEDPSKDSKDGGQLAVPEALRTDHLQAKSPKIPNDEFDIVALANFLHQSQKVWSERQTQSQPSLGAWRGQNWDSIKYEPDTQSSWKDPITAWQELGVGSQRGYSAFYSPEEVPGWDPSAFAYNKIVQNQRQPRSEDINMDALKEYIFSLPLPIKQAVLSNTESTRTKRHVFLGEDINCEWNIESEPGLFLLVTFNKLSAEYSVDCTGAYIEVERENNGFDARWCGNRVAMDGSRSHVIFAKSKVRISVFDNGDSTKMHPTGFEADVEAIDLFDNDDYKKLSRARSKMRRLVET